MIADAGAFCLASPNGMIRPFISSDWSTRTSSARKRGGEQPVPKAGLPGSRHSRARAAAGAAVRRRSRREQPPLPAGELDSDKLMEELKHFPREQREGDAGQLAGLP